MKGGKSNMRKMAKINWELDTNPNLREGFRELTEQYDTLTENEYMQQSLKLLEQEGISLTADELRNLLIVRRQTDKMLQEEKVEQDILKKRS